MSPRTTPAPSEALAQATTSEVPWMTTRDITVPDLTICTPSAPEDRADRHLEVEDLGDGVSRCRSCGTTWSMRRQS